MTGERRWWETPFLVTPCTRCSPSGEEGAATEGGIVVTVERDNCPAEREREVDQTRQGFRLTRGPGQGYCQDDLVSEGFSLILAFSVIRKGFEGSRLPVVGKVPG